MGKAPERPEVGAVVGCFVRDHLWRHVLRRTYEIAEISCVNRRDRTDKLFERADVGRGLPQLGEAERHRVVVQHLKIK